MESRRYYHIEDKLSDSKFQVPQHVLAMQGSGNNNEISMLYLQVARLAAISIYKM